MEKYCMRSIGSHPVESTYLQRKGGDISATWLANCQSENMRLIINNHHFLTVSVGFEFFSREKKRPEQLSKLPETFARRII